MKGTNVAKIEELCRWRVTSENSQVPFLDIPYLSRVFPAVVICHIFFLEKAGLGRKCLESQNHPPLTLPLPMVASFDKSAAQFISKSSLISQYNNHYFSIEICHICYSVIVLPFGKMKALCTIGVILAVCSSRLSTFNLCLASLNCQIRSHTANVSIDWYDEYSHE